MNLIVGLTIIFLLCLNLAVGLLNLAGITHVDKQTSPAPQAGFVIDV